MLVRFRHALFGLGVALRHRGLLYHVVFAVFVVALGFLICLDRMSWALVALAIGFVFSTETVNTALEQLGDAVSPHQRPGIRRAKDVSAAAVLIAAGSSVVLGLIVFLPPLITGTAGRCIF